MPIKRIERKEYLDRLIAFRDKKIIKVVTGVRRCGKSVLLEIFQDYLLSEGVSDSRIISINLEDYDFYELRNGRNLHEYIRSRLSDDKMTYIFIDEVQQCADFADAVNSLFLRNNVDIYLTGSNANMLSSEIATLLSGRYVEIMMLPLSFAEYVKSTGNKNELPRKYREYIENSSFPYTLEIKGQTREIRDYLDGLYSTIIIKDISQRNRLNDTMLLESIIRFLFDNIGSNVSTKKIADSLTSYGRKIDTKTVEKYLGFLMESFIVYQAQRYNIKGKQYLKTLEKYYIVDVGLRFMLLGNRGIDAGHILENVIYLELLRRGYNVYVGKIDEQEIDFVAENEGRLTYFQVALSVRDDNTLSRELKPLQKIKDSYPKFILTLDDDPDGDYDGIYRINALEWMTDSLAFGQHEQ